ncbi:MAG: hypothetical protein ACMUIA_10110 [bacterium]
MKKCIAALIIIALVFFVFIFGTGDLAEAQTATQLVTFEVQAIDAVSVSGDPGALVIGGAAAGSPPTSATDSTTSYAITTNQANRRITGAIDSAMPANTTLSINLAAPIASGTSAGDVSLSTTALDLVTGINALAESARTITYTFSATPAAGVIASTSRTVTLTLTAGT